MTVLKRKMFRKKGNSKGTGIMASGPELLKRFNGGGVNVPGGGSTLTRSGFPGLRAFGGLGQNIPMAGKVPGLNKFGNPVVGPLSAFGGEGERIISAQTGFPLSYLLAGDETRKRMFDEEGEKAKTFYEQQAFRKQNVESGDVSKQNLGIATSDDPTVINTSIKNILDKAQRAVETDVEAQRSEELAIIGEGDPGEGIDFTAEVKTEDKEKKTKPDIGNKDYGLGVVKQKKKDGSLSSNVTSDNTDVNKGIVNLNKMITKSTPGSSESIAANKKINKLISESIKNDNVNKATEANLVASGGATPESVKEMSQEDKDKALRERISNLYGKDIGLEGDLKAMNLVMLGLRIAAGDSPYAMTNIAKGGLEQMEDIGKKAKEKQDRDDKIASLIVSESLNRESKETDFSNQKEIKKIDQKHDISMFKMQDTAAIKRDVKKMNFQVLMQDKSNLHSLGLKKIDYQMHGESLKQAMSLKVMDIESAEKRTLAQIQASADQLKFKQISAEEHAENMFQLNKELELEKTMLSNMPKGYVLGLMEGKKKGLKDKELIDFAAEQGSRFAKARVLTGSETLKGSLFGIVEAQVKDGISVDDALKSTLNNPNFQKLHKTELTKLGLFTQQAAPTLKSLGLGEMPEGTVLGQDGKPYTGSGPKFIVGAGGTIQKG
jgi:hypothetical protein